MREHPLDREVRLPGVGGTEEGGDGAVHFGARMRPAGGFGKLDAPAGQGSVAVGDVPELCASTGIRGEQPLDEKGAPLPPVGYNKNERNVFSVSDEAGQPVLRISGEIYGCVFTRKEFANYRLKLQVRWGTKKWDPRLDLPMDSGILYHSQGECGRDYWRSWMLSQEFQIMEGSFGDYWSQMTSQMDVRVTKPPGSENHRFDPAGSLLSFGSGTGRSGYCQRSGHRGGDRHHTRIARGEAQQRFAEDIGVHRDRLGDCYRSGSRAWLGCGDRDFLWRGFDTMPADRIFHRVLVALSLVGDQMDEDRTFHFFARFRTAITSARLCPSMGPTYLNPRFSKNIPGTTSDLSESSMRRAIVCSLSCSGALPSASQTWPRILFRNGSVMISAR